MELLFLAILVLLMAVALGAGYPVAFSLPGSAVITIALAATAGMLSGGGPDAFFAQGGPGQWLSAGVTNLRGVYWEVERDTLIAIPLFIFMGIMLQRSKIAEDLLVAMAQLFGPIPGGLGIAVVFVGALLAATTGIVGATVVAMGLISLPAMLRNNYAQSLATGTIAASGTLGQIIPPSIVLIILADQLASAVDQASTARKALFKDATGEISMPSTFDVSSTSAGEMFLGALVPGIVLVLLYMLFIFVFAMVRPKSAPAVPYEGDYDRRFFVRSALILIPPLTLIFLVLGSIISGIATVNQAGAIGAAGALIMAGYRLREGDRLAYVPAIIALIALGVIAYVVSNYDTNIKNIHTPEDATAVMVAVGAVVALLFSLAWSGWRAYVTEDALRGVMIETAKTTSLVFIILLGAAMLTAAFRAFGGEDLVKGFLNSLSGGFWTQFIIVMAVIFILGFFLDFIEIAVVVVPIVAPILLADPSANITAVWLGVMIGLNIQTSFLTPPFGFALFYLRGVAPAVVRTVNMYKGVVAFISLQLLALLIVGLYPPLVNYLPNRVSLTGESAPPPRNPRLQACLEDYVHQALMTDGATIRGAISEARGLDLSYLPDDLADDLTGSFDDAEKAISLVDEIYAAEDVVVANADAYRPVHLTVRRIEKDIRRREDDIAVLETRMSRLRGENVDARRTQIESRIAEEQAEIEDLAAGIPAEWEDVNGNFAKLVASEQSARNLYRRTADRAAEPVIEVLAVLNATDDLIALGDELKAFRQVIVDLEPADAVEPISELRSRVGAVEGASDIRSAVNKARSALRARTPDKDEALEHFDRAIALYDAQLVWQTRAAEELAPSLLSYQSVIGDTIGARQQPRLTNTQALFIASCNASHRDLSLNF